MKERLILDSPQRGSWNMAVDQALLDSTDQTGRLTLRIYSWQAPTLSLGYFQRHAERAAHVESQGCDWLRRSSGVVMRCRADSTQSPNRARLWQDDEPAGRCSRRRKGDTEIATSLATSP